jgi:cytochrome c biogenesis protein CcmG/thiol:disulfide interchange protein DsbE
MKKIFLTLIFLFSSILISWAQEAETDTVKYQKAPNFTLMSTENKNVTLDSLLKNGPVYLECWDLPCKNCIKELDALMPIYDTLKERGLQIIALSVDKPADEAKVKTFVKSKKWQYYVLLDNKGKVKDLYHITIKPTAYLINQKGEIVYTHIGFKQGDEKRIKDEFLKWLPEPDSGEGSIRPAEEPCEQEESEIEAEPEEKDK